MWFRVVNVNSRMFVIIFWLKAECFNEKIKIKVKLCKYKTYHTETTSEQKRINTGKSYAETIIAMSENI